MNISTNTSTWLNRFKIEITSNSHRLFSNGRQQIEVTVVVAPALGKTVTDEQLDSIVLVTLDDDGVYRELTGELKVSTTRNPLFDYFAASSGAPQNHELSGTTKRKRFYITSTRIGGSLDKVYARISRNADTYHVTNGGSFQSSITVESLKPLRYEKDDFELLRKDIVTDSEVDVDLYSLSFKDKTRRIIKSIPYDTVRSAASQWGGWRATPGPVEKPIPHYHMYYKKLAGEVQSIIKYLHTRTYFFHYAFEVGKEATIYVKERPVTINKAPAHMNFLRARVMYRSFETLTPEAITHRSRWGVLDQYGNETKIEFLQKDEGNLIDFKRYD